MLKTECAKCGAWVVLPFKVEEANCPNCGEVVPVKEVFISAGPYTIYRDVLKKNMFKYKRLIIEAEKEMADLRSRPGGRKYDISVDTIKQLLANLKEMLDGCRDHLRHELDANVTYMMNQQAYPGRVVNLSLSGICIEAGKSSSMNKLLSDVEVRLKTGKDLVNIKGKVMWIGNGDKMGIKFINIDENLMDTLKDYILMNWDKAKELRTVKAASKN